MIAHRADNHIENLRTYQDEQYEKIFFGLSNLGDKIEQRPVTTGARLGELWLVQSGLKAGERIVVEGVQKAQAGVVVNPVVNPVVHPVVTPVVKPVAGKP